MQKLKIWTIATLVWFFLFYNVERLHAPLNLASFVYGYVCLLTLIPLVFRSLGSVGLSCVAVAAGLLMLVLKGALGYSLLHGHLPITVTELCACLIALALGQKLSERIFAVEQAMIDFVVPGTTVADFNDGQELIYREIQRARQFDRSLVMVALSPDKVSADQCGTKLLDELCHAVQRRYLDARFCELAGKELRDCDILCRRDDHFLLIMPESSADHAKLAVNKIVDRARSELGIDLKSGISNFPDEEVTFSGLLDRVESEISDRVGELEGSSRSPTSGPADCAQRPSLEAQHASL